jgi:uncharacterized protein YdaU (DUF1376 family)
VDPMTSQQIADEALALWQSHKGDDQERMDSILREFFSQVREDEYEHQLRCVAEIMSCPEITGSSLPLPSSAAF